MRFFFVKNNILQYNLILLSVYVPCMWRLGVLPYLEYTTHTSIDQHVANSLNRSIIHNRVMNNSLLIYLTERRLEYA